MRAFVKESIHLDRKYIDFGWGNGYVVIPAGHILHGVDYNNIEVEVHGGLTFSDHADQLDWPEIKVEDNGSWIIGFDTAHAYDTLDNWPKEKVQKEADLLLKQVINYQIMPEGIWNKLLDSL